MLSFDYVSEYGPFPISIYNLVDILIKKHSDTLTMCEINELRELQDRDYVLDRDEVYSVLEKLNLINQTNYFEESLPKSSPQSIKYTTSTHYTTPSPQKSVDYYKQIIQHQENLLAKKESEIETLEMSLAEFKKQVTQLKQRSDQYESLYHALEDQIATNVLEKNVVAKRSQSVQVDDVNITFVSDQLRDRDIIIQDLKESLKNLQELLIRKEEESRELVEIPRPMEQQKQEQKDSIFNFRSSRNLMIYSFSFWFLGISMAVAIILRYCPTFPILQVIQ